MNETKKGLSRLVTPFFGVIGFWNDFQFAWTRKEEGNNAGEEGREGDVIANRKG